MASESDIISPMPEGSALLPTLFWPRNVRDPALYQSVRRLICDAAGVMPSTVSESIDLTDFFNKSPDATLYYPVFTDSRGWWGELLGTNARVAGKLIVSPECQLMIIHQNQLSDDARPAAGRTTSKTHELYAAEIFPTSAFFKKMNSGIATALDMLATDSGTILALFCGKSQKKFLHALESTGNTYLGTIGGY